LDLIIANNVGVQGIGFNADDNAVTLIDSKHQQELTLASKQQLAREIIAIIAQKLTAKP
jgi:phosphopantothenoylcysteine decarboxylase/phosphopantothenate--cysteine ligase